MRCATDGIFVLLSVRHQVFWACLVLLHLLPSVDDVANCQDRVPAHHPGTGVSHNLFDLFTHFTAVAVYGAFITDGFVFLERAIIEFLISVFGQCPAFGAKSGFHSVQISTVKPDHRSNCEPLSREPLSGEWPSGHS